MTPGSPQNTVVRTPTDLTDLWARLMGPGSFSIRSLWMIFIGRDGRLSPVVAPIDDIPIEPDESLLGGITHVIDGLTGDGELAAAFLLSRPGPDHVLVGDRRWASGLMTALGPQLSRWPVHFATSGRVRAIAPDDLIAA